MFAGFIIVGCGELREYRDQDLGVTVRRLDPQLENRWGVQGVVVSESTGKTLIAGDLITHLVSRRTVQSESDVTSALASAMGPRKHWWDIRKQETSDASAVLELERGGQTLYVPIAARKPGEWNDLGLELSGTQIAGLRKRYEDSPSPSPAESAGLKAGDTIRAVLDEESVPTPKRFKKASARANAAANVYFYTRELTGIRLEALRTLGELGEGNPTVLTKLLAIVQSPGDLTLRRTAARALVSLAPHQTDATLARAMLETIRSEPDEEIRRNAASILEILVKQLPTETYDENAIAALAIALRDPVPGVHFKAGVILSSLGERALPTLVAALNDPNPTVRDISATALGDIGGTHARDTLLTALQQTTDVPLQLTIATALSKIGDARSRQELSALSERTSDRGVREFVRQLLAASAPAIPSTAS